MNRHLNLIIDFLRRRVLYASSLTLPKIYQSDSLEIQRSTCDLTSYALGWREGLEAAVKYLNDLGFERDITDVEEELSALSLTPWPEHPEYGWKSETEPVIGTPVLQSIWDTVDKIHSTHPGFFSTQTLDCKGISLDSTHGKVDSNQSSSVSSSPASSGSDPWDSTWTRADDITEGYPV